MTESDRAGASQRLTRAASRRSVLAGAGALGAAGLLAACGTDEPATVATDPAPADTTAPPPPPPPASSPTDIPASEIPVGGGKIFDEQRIVVTQPTAGTYKAFDSLCTHQGCVVTSVVDGKINCPCHQSQFSIADGSVLRGPATRALDAKTATVTDTTITVA